jgi:RNA polymerase sigma-70 factor (ECF subfamily)
MQQVDDAVRAGLAALRVAVFQTAGVPALAPAPGMPGSAGDPAAARLAALLMAEALGDTRVAIPRQSSGGRPPCDDDPEASRLMGLVDLARSGDCDAFGLLYDHYNGTVFRFLYYRVGSHSLAEDLTSETFFRALRSMSGFKWQGRDFGAWLITIARNLVADHFKAGRTRLETATDDLSDHDTATPGPEDDVLASLTNEVLLRALRELAPEQQECLVLRFLQGMSIAETAKILQRSDGAVKQLQLRAIRNLGKLLPEGMR